MERSIAAYVAAVMDDVPMTSFHWRVVALILAGFFLDLVDIAMFSMVALLLIGAGVVLMTSRETKGLALDAIAPPC
jgi:hypothetical protein